MATILDGRKLKTKILANLKSKIAQMEEKPSLTVILAGNNPASLIYVNNKKRTAEEIGINSNIIGYGR